MTESARGISPEEKAFHEKLRSAMDLTARLEEAEKLLAQAIADRDSLAALVERMRDLLPWWRG